LEAEALLKAYSYTVIPPDQIERAYKKNGKQIVQANHSAMLEFQQFQQFQQTQQTR